MESCIGMIILKSEYLQLVMYLQVILYNITIVLLLGSGNGLSKSICLYSNEQFSKEVSAFLSIKGETKSIDLLEIELPSLPKPVYSFHSFSWGFVADAGLESERYRYILYTLYIFSCRCCGDMRFTCYPLWRLLCLCTRKYYASIYYLKSDVDDNLDLDTIPSIKTGPLDDRFVRINEEIRFTWAINIPWMTHKITAGPNTTFDDGLFELLVRSLY
jgi:hypothetical protein